jgi:hypothetical protein
MKLLSLLGLCVLFFVAGCDGDKKRGLAVVKEGRELLVALGSLDASAPAPTRCPDDKLSAMNLTLPQRRVELLERRLLPALAIRPVPNQKPTAEQYAQLKMLGEVDSSVDRSVYVVKLIGQRINGGATYALARDLSENGLKFLEDQSNWNEFVVNRLQTTVARAKAYRFVGIVSVTEFTPAKFGSTTDALGHKMDQLSPGGRYNVQMVPGLIKGKVTFFDRETRAALCAHELKATNSDSFHLQPDGKADDDADRDLASNFVRAITTDSSVLSLE